MRNWAIEYWSWSGALFFTSQ